MAPSSTTNGLVSLAAGDPFQRRWLRGAFCRRGSRDAFDPWLSRRNSRYLRPARPGFSPGRHRASRRESRACLSLVPARAKLQSARWQRHSRCSSRRSRSPVAIIRLTIALSYTSSTHKTGVADVDCDPATRGSRSPRPRAAAQNELTKARASPKVWMSEKGHQSDLRAPGCPARSHRPSHITHRFEVAACCAKFARFWLGE
jgi:hypothetical protein